MDRTPTQASRRWTPEAIGDLTGRTALVTGGNSGVGLETARVLAAHGAGVVLAGRDEGRLEAAADELRAAQPKAFVETLVVDLGSLRSVAGASSGFAASRTLDLLVNNAGVMNVPDRRATADGFELTFGTNHLGHFALTAGLMPALRRSPAARVVTVSAIAASWRSGRLDDLMSERRYAPMTAYAKSKRANVVFTVELARRLAGTSVEALVVHPGAAMTNLQRHGTGAASRLVTAVASRLLMGSPEGAAWPSLYVATSPDATSGGFYGPAGRDQTSGTPRRLRLRRWATDPAEGAAFWAASEQLTGVRFDIGPAASATE